MKLIPEWRKAWRMFSVQALAVIAMLPLIWSELPPDLVAMIPPAWTPYILTALAVAGIVGRLVDQRTRE